MEVSEGLVQELVQVLGRLVESVDRLSTVVEKLETKLEGKAVRQITPAPQLIPRPVPDVQFEPLSSPDDAALAAFERLERMYEKEMGRPVPAELDLVAWAEGKADPLVGAGEHKGLGLVERLRRLVVDESGALRG
jgi:hypothetical protein